MQIQERSPATAVRGTAATRGQIPCGSFRPIADIGLVGWGARKRTLVLSSSGCPVWELKPTFAGSGAAPGS